MGCVLAISLTVGEAMGAGGEVSAPAGSAFVEPLQDSGVLGLARFYRQLRAVRRGRRKQVRICHWGDSHVAAAAMTDRLRTALQQRFGDGGPGWFIPGRPWRSYAHGALGYRVAGPWRALRLWAHYSRRRPQPPDDLFGLAGTSVIAPLPAQTWVWPREGRLDRVDLYYLRQPGGGQLQLLVDRRLLRRVSTASRGTRAGYARIDLRRPGHTVVLRTRGGAVRLFGIDLLRRQPGIVYDAFGINGATASSQLRWNEPLMADQLRRIKPQLVLLAYGSNEIDMTGLTRQGFVREFNDVLERMRRMVPKAACLVLGPTDQARRNPEDGRWVLPPQLDWLIADQRRLARAHGCAFWDERRAMGGRGAIFRWVAAEPPLARPDHLHLPPGGYRLLADALAAAIVQSFEHANSRRRVRSVR